jgi:2-C-methyl-D-erythritol 4-phosphate cytidylyltransferase/2-C-methyl-D-erythritol 2,4-cyclodiphosphate synthase
MAEAPKLLPYKAQMKTTLASILGIRANFINIKATTAEKLGFVGRKEGVTVHAVANLTYFNWKNL